MEKYVILAAFLWVGPSQSNSDFEILDISHECGRDKNYEKTYSKYFSKYPSTSFIVEIEPGVFKIDYSEKVADIRTLPSNLVYYYYNQRNTAGIKIDYSDLHSLIKAKFNASKNTIFIIHGFRSDHTSPVNDIRHSILRKKDVNVFVVDWGSVARRNRCNYKTVTENVNDIGRHLADFISSMVQKLKVKINKIGFIGHSLGAHVAGSAGSVLKGKVKFIVGLDPAGPRFSLKDTEKRLDPTDALFVQVIHTNKFLLGVMFISGHADFYPNDGGPFQPGCGWSPTCAHKRAYIFYNESVWSNKKFVGTLCKDYPTYTAGNCNTNKQSAMGRFPIDRTEGTFYLDTNSESPFPKGK